MHKVTPKETFYSIARHYNVHPRYLIRFNTHIDGLQIGDTVRMEIDRMNTFQNLVLVPENDQTAQETTFPTPTSTAISTYQNTPSTNRVPRQDDCSGGEEVDST